MENIIDQCLQKPAVSLKEMRIFVWEQEYLNMCLIYANDSGY